ncbi:LysM peptidoglycan-binding domain-containing protein [Streptomyces bathyalis]|uniref:LysM peptidoglycan-binding domain-containing protein n=1 Tax=Streptomyces bathyalis TaxID=2710756 RepID=A0A7T1T7I3_9ACTN|nr:LysM domain-containing protein [Streptomyces bathyalis]QPP07837.1 LysM peptidoglycan-binding domain-containing protein [Streptomyces bathyalis]
MTTQTSNATYYVVRTGDTLSEIAEMYGTTVEQLAKWNDIPDVDVIKAGQKLIVRKSASPHETHYTVKRGDTLSEIAEMYETTVDQLAKWNNIPDVDVIKAGQKLIVAKSEHSAAAA